MLAKIRTFQRFVDVERVDEQHIQYQSGGLAERACCLLELLTNPAIAKVAALASPCASTIAVEKALMLWCRPSWPSISIQVFVEACSSRRAQLELDVEPSEYF